MKTSLVVAATMSAALVGCKGKSTPNPTPTPAPGPAPAAATKQAEPSEDPRFVRVDHDQLAALCLAKALPPGSWPSDYGALVLADGSRVPWLTMWVDEIGPRPGD